MIRRYHSTLESMVCEAPIGEHARGASEAVAILRTLIGSEPCEVFAVLLLNTAQRVTGYVEVSRGGLSSALVHPREVFIAAIRHSAASIIVAHNHPSGDPEPSSPDLAVTKRLRDAGELLGIPVVDHVIIGDPGYVSLRAWGGW